MLRLRTADSLIQAGKSKISIDQYNKISKENTLENLAVAADYSEILIKVNHINPVADYNKTLETFKAFINKHPDSRQAIEAKCWISLLKRLDSLERKNNTCLEVLRNSEQKIEEDLNSNAALKNNLTQCQQLRDTLLNKVKELESKEKVLRSVIDRIVKMK